jgi:hypothetical protein
VIQSLQRDDVVPHWANERDGRVVASRNLLLVLRGRRGLVPKHKAGDFEGQDWEVSRYFVYLTNRAAGKAA